MNEVEYRFLRSQWFPIARSQDVVEGQPVRSRILDVDLVVFRSDGKVTVAGNWCPHRGMDLSMGKVVGSELECAYHGWRFRASDGRCSLIPSLEPGSHPGTGRLPVYRALEQYGHVWSCLDEPSAPAPSIPDLDESAGWQVHYGTPHDLHCGIRQLTENFRDMSHFPFVHFVSMGPNVARVVAPYTVERKGRDLIWTLPTDLGGTALGGKEAVATRQLMTYHLTLPTFSRIRTEFPQGGKRYTVQIGTPIDRDGEHSRQFWFVAIDPIVADTHGVSIHEMWEYERQIFEEDWPIVENQMPRETPLDLKAQAHTRADKFSVKYRQVYSELMGAFSAPSSNGARPKASSRARSGARG